MHSYHVRASSEEQISGPWAIDMLCVRNAWREVIHSSLGPFAVAEDKTLTGRALDFIGWNINLDTRMLGIARHNFLKTFWGFARLSEGQYIRVRHIQKLASWSSRYALVSRYMKPFSHVLHKATAGFHDIDTLIKLPTEVWAVVGLWRMFSIVDGSLSTTVYPFN